MTTTESKNLTKKFTFKGAYKNALSNTKHDITVEINLKYKDNKPRFSASASVWDRRHTNIIAGGQCLDELVEHLKDNELFMEIHRLWKLYHLNNSHAWCACEHEENPREVVKVYKLRYNEEGKRLSKIRDLGIFKQWIIVTEAGYKNIPSALYELDEYKTLHESGIEEKTRGWIKYDLILSPEGLLGKECPTCGAKYGHGWYYHEIPADYLKAIKDLFD